MHPDWNSLTIDKDTEITLKGFLYSTPDDQWILSSEPDVKHCCLGSVNKKETQIYLKGQFDPKYQGQIIKVTGLLKKDAASSFYHLANPTLHSYETSLFFIGCILSLIFLGVFIVIKKKR